MKETYWELRILINEKFGTQSDFAMKVHGDESFISRVVNGRRKLSKQQAEVWAKVLERDISFLNPVVAQPERSPKLSLISCSKSD
jgi:transcriptional regulator with XRE-family HTH domain